MLYPKSNCKISSGELFQIFQICSLPSCPVNKASITTNTMLCNIKRHTHVLTFSNSFCILGAWPNLDDYPTHSRYSINIKKLVPNGSVLSLLLQVRENFLCGFCVPWTVHIDFRSFISTYNVVMWLEGFKFVTCLCK